MRYYKIPIINGVFDYPVGCVLCCAYPQGTDMICKFETCPEVGPGWVEITAEEFEANCPDFPQVLPENPSDDPTIESWAMAFEPQKCTLTLDMSDGSVDTHIVETDENDNPTKLIVNGVEIPGVVTGV